LQERRGDIPLLISNFLKQYNITKGSAVSRIAEDAMDILLNYHYPGNVRELENIIEHAGVLCQGEVIEPRHLPMYIQEITGRRGEDRIARVEVAARRDQRERELILEVLEQHRWHRQKAAQDLGMDRTTLWRKMKKYGISP
jgi:transcriptional regulator with PAS, ATPase and Fis domain